MVAVLLLWAQPDRSARQTPADTVEEPDASQQSDRVGEISRRDLSVRFVLDGHTVLASESAEGSPSESGALRVDAALTPIQYLRLLSMPFTGAAVTETVMGQRQFECVRLRAVPGVADSSPPGSEASATVECDLPGRTETVPGLRARLTVQSEIQPDVLLAPNLFIGYDADDDEYYVNVKDGATVTRTSVEVGVTDGVARVISSPQLPEGTQLAPIETNR
ncbi:MAG: hypothetical protein Q4G67_10395 [Actinomycetia bacterium]|nr:hypothetical protein [Actinomycetes bacterium]